MRLLAACLALLLAGCGSLQRMAAADAERGISEVRMQERLPCGPRRLLVDFLVGVWAQRPVAQGLAVPGGMIAQASVIEILATGDGSRWTAILTAPSGLSCVLAGGEAWQPLAEIGVSYRP